MNFDLTKTFFNIKIMQLDSLTTEILFLNTVDSS